MTEKTDLKLLARALAFAALKHKNHKRKDCDKTPYINHPIALMNLLVNGAGITDPEILSAALLHDTVERIPMRCLKSLQRHLESLSPVLSRR